MSFIDWYYKYLYKVTYKLWMLFSRMSRTHGVVLMYHHVTDEYVDEIEPCKCKIDTFRDTLEKMLEEGFCFVTIDKALYYIRHRTKIKFAIVTFDDVPVDVYENAYPILKNLQLPFVLFITTDYLDKPGYLTTEQLREMDLDSLCTVGAHTKSHPMLRRVENSYEEMKASKKILENLLGHSVDYMAYPYGLQTSVSIKIMQQAKQIGYKCAFGTIQTPISDFSALTRFYLPRMVIN